MWSKCNEEDKGIQINSILTIKVESNNLFFLKIVNFIWNLQKIKNGLRKRIVQRDSIIIGHTTDMSLINQTI